MLMLFGTEGSNYLNCLHPIKMIWVTTSAKLRQNWRYCWAILRSSSRVSNLAARHGGEKRRAGHRQEILELAAKYTLPVVSIYKDFAKSGGMIAYGPNLDVVYRRAAHFVDKIIKGERASDLPVEQPVTFDLVINQRAAKTLGIKIAQPVLIRADEVIE
jgi:hypothetical protein